MLDIAALLENRITELGLTRTKAAGRLGVEQPTISRWLNRVNFPTDKHVGALQEFLGLSHAEVLYAVHLAKVGKGNPYDERLTALEVSVRQLREEWTDLRDELLAELQEERQPRNQGRRAASSHPQAEQS